MPKSKIIEHGKNRERIATVFLIIPILLLIAFIISFSRITSKPKYNVILISIDSLRRDHMSLYGYGRKTTPNIDEFAKDAYVADNYFSTSYLTPISEASVHTGFYPQKNQVINFASELNTNTPTIAEILRANGYRTAAFGDSPEFRPQSLIGNSLKRGYQSYNISSIRNGDLTWNKITDWMKGKKPFFLWLPLGLVHFPYGWSPDNFSNPSYQGILKGDSLGYYTVGFMYKNKLFNNADALKTARTMKDYFMMSAPTIEVNKTIDLKNEDIQYIIDKYDDGIYYVDEYISKLFAYLKDTKIIDNTIVMIQSEHGEDLNEHQYIMHYDIWDTTVHSPLIIKFPQSKGVRSDDLISGVDILPSILETLGIKYGKSDGISFLKTINNNNSLKRKEVYLSRTPLWETIRTVSNYFPKRLELWDTDPLKHFQDYAIRDDRWKLIHRKARNIEKQYSWYSFLSGEPIDRDEYELYDIKSDPTEQHNIYRGHEKESKYLLDKLTIFEKEAESRLQNLSGNAQSQPYF